MSNIISNEKRHNQDKKKNILIHSQTSAIKTQIKKTKLSKNKNDLNKCFSLIDGAITKGIFTKNKANRLKSNLTIFCNDINKTYSPKIEKTKKTVKKVEVKKADVKKETIIKKDHINDEALKREQEELKVVEVPPKINLVDKNKKDVKNIDPVDLTTSIIMISISPSHANTFFENSEKNVLFYKITPINKVTRVLIYSTKPIQKVIGEFDLEKINITSPAASWKKYGKNSVLTKKEFDEYYLDKDKAHALISSKSFKYVNPKDLKQFNMSKGPSGFQYLK